MAHIEKELASVNFPRWNSVKECRVVLGAQVCWGGFEDHYKKLNLIVDYPDLDEARLGKEVEDCIRGSAVATALGALILAFTPVGWVGLSAACAAFVTATVNCLKGKLVGHLDQIRVELRVID